jgi:sugar/nucleoside kinase (ribokinase family)
MPRSERDYESLRDSVIHKLQGARIDADIVTMPDFFLDHALTYDREAKAFAGRVLSVASRGGGEIPDIPQELEVGGNAAICTLALGAFGAKVHPIIKTNRLGLFLMRYFYEPLGVDLTHIKANGNLVPTIILEMKSKRRRVNVMLGDSSRVSEFSFNNLDARDLETMTTASHVCVFNWLYNRKGTELAESVFEYCKEKSHARTFFDPIDPRPRLGELQELASKVLRGDLLDSLAVNENEALLFASLYEKKKTRLGRRTSIEARALEAGRVITANTGVRVHVHTADYSSSIMGDSVSVVPSFAVQMQRGTGAGDTWNAGYLIGDALRLIEDEKLLFANAVAARYISNPRRIHATLNDVIEFLRDKNHKLKRLSVD